MSDLPPRHRVVGRGHSGGCRARASGCSRMRGATAGAPSEERRAARPAAHASEAMCSGRVRFEDRRMPGDPLAQNRRTQRICGSGVLAERGRHVASSVTGLTHGAVRAVISPLETGVTTRRPSAWRGSIRRAATVPLRGAAVPWPFSDGPVATDSSVGLDFGPDLLYNRASADRQGRPWSERKKLIWWDPESCACALRERARAPSERCCALHFRTEQCLGGRGFGRRLRVLGDARSLSGISRTSWSWSAEETYQTSPASIMGAWLVPIP